MQSEVIGSGLGVELSQTISFNGHLDGTDEVRQQLHKILGKVAGIGGEWKVDAGNMSLNPAGVEVWIEATRQHLNNCQLVYSSSQLATVMRFDPRYNHGESSYEDFQSSTEDDSESGDELEN